MEFEIQPVLSATDIDRAKHWYSDKLGLEPVSIEGEPLAPGSNTAL
jgi:catechol 2,3-dioxygenase-like lactoylglutathione lyase family enzyme